MVARKGSPKLCPFRIVNKIGNMASSSREILILYKQLLREAGKFPSYMYRTYSIRRIKDSFRDHKKETDVQKIEDLLTYAKSNLEIIKRQVVIGQLYKGQDELIEKYIQSKKSAQTA